MHCYSYKRKVIDSEITRYSVSLGDIIKKYLLKFTANSLECEIVTLEYEETSTLTEMKNKMEEIIDNKIIGIPAGSLILTQIWDYTVEFMKLLNTKGVDHKIVSYSLGEKRVIDYIKTQSDKNVLDGHFIINTIFSFSKRQDSDNYRTIVSTRFGDEEYFFAEESLVL